MAAARTFAVILIATLLAAPMAMTVFAADGHPAVAPAASKPIGRIKTLSGVVTVERGGEQSPAKLGAAVYQGDILRTGPNGSVGVAFVDNSLFSTGPSSELGLPEFAFEPGAQRGNMLATLRKGTLTAVTGAITHGAPGAMSIKTPTSLLGIRGTTFAVEVAVVGICQCISDRTAPHLRCLPNAHYCQMACASTHYSFVPASSAELAACPPQDKYPQERYVVLPNADGRPGSGAITVKSGGGATTLDQPYAAAELLDGQTTSRAMNPNETQDIFQQAFAARPALPAEFRLDFALDSDRLAPEGLTAYRALLAEIKKRQIYEVAIVGHTDLLVSEARNKRLSWDRAVAVRSALLRDGVAQDAITVNGRGDSEPLVRGTDPRNRRVDVSVR